MATQENDTYESIERMISFTLGDEFNLDENTDREYVKRVLFKKFVENSSAELILKYRPTQSISTADIDDMIQELYMEGLEVVMVVHDYIKRIKPVNTAKERHIELGNVVDEESAISKKYNIPFVTAMQLNRSAYTAIEAALASGDPDAVKKLNPSNVGESIMVYENADFVIFQGRVYSNAIKRLMLTMQLAKSRAKRNKDAISYIALPFSVNEDGSTNEMQIEEDYDDVTPKGFTSVTEAIQEMFDPNADNASQPIQTVRSNSAKQPQKKSQSLPAKRVGVPMKIEDGEISNFANDDDDLS